MSTSKIWGGRFSSSPAEIMEEINASIDFDHQLASQDIAGSRAHAQMLAKCGVISQEDCEAILGGLDQIAQEIAAGKLVHQRQLEDIHMHIEARLHELIGPTAGRLHTARSRNDQVATDFRLWVREACDHADTQLRDLQEALLTKAQQHAETAMPGMTHLQTAQPITLGHYLLAFVEMFGRDRDRFQTSRSRLNESPLGSAALAGTSFPIDREMTAQALGFFRPMANSLDGVSSRDFALDYLSNAAICITHLSRLAEDLVIWSSAPFGFIRLPDSLTTGSSIMPQKRNPDAAELIRGKTGRIYGNFQNLLTIMKGLSLAYAKDLQEDKEPVFDTAKNLDLALAAMSAMVSQMQANLPQMAQAAAAGFSTATDLADYLVRVENLPFRQAHHITGALVKLAEEQQCALSELPLQAMQNIHPPLTSDVYSVLTVEKSLQSKTSFGGTAPDNVRQAITVAQRKYL